jgi:hypothetical protein
LHIFDKIFLCHSAKKKVEKNEKNFKTKRHEKNSTTRVSKGTEKIMVGHQPIISVMAHGSFFSKTNNKKEKQTKLRSEKQKRSCHNSYPKTRP